MNDTTCSEFHDWLERLPRKTLSPAFKTHLDICEQCRNEYDQLSVLTDILASDQLTESLDEQKLMAVAEIAAKTSMNRENRRLIIGLSTIGILCLPIIILINSVWGYLGYNLISSYVSPTFAKTYLTLFVITTTGLLSVSYGCIPILAGWIRRPAPKEIER